MSMHSLMIEDRKQITITDVADVESFDEETILLSLHSGGLLLKGQDLHIQKLDIEEGKAIITGTVNSAAYTAKREKSEGGLLKKLLK
ncbi:MAG TPA: sporulation protein YabP [Clostridiales bacterium UBA9856]|jgi:sporulation protein YabP|nr:sporulation protein YabP [Clostridiales bacterium UBA9856]